MGSCLSKKNVCSSSPPPVALPHKPETIKSEIQPAKKEAPVVKKEIFIIKHRISHELQRPTAEENSGENASSSNGGGAAVDAILRQRGRLSRSFSTGKKRSFGFDSENGKCDDNNADGDDEAVYGWRERHRRSEGRSESRERGGGRRVSRSPGKRSESPITINNGANCRAGKMVSVPATVAVNKTTNSGGDASVKRIQVMRNVGSPRARSPARLRGGNENHNMNTNPDLQQPICLSRSNSRKKEVSPFRRNPLSEIDTNIISKKPNTDIKAANEADNKMDRNNVINCNCETLARSNLIPQNLKTRRSRSSRLSRDLEIHPETLSNLNNSYTALLLEDIHNFHQKNTSTPPPTAFSLPPCVTKARSILDAVADLNANHVNDQINKFNEIGASDDLMQPRLHKYVTVRRGTNEDLEEEESSGSNSFAGRKQQWTLNSAESTGRWSRSISRQNEGGKGLSAGKKRDAGNEQSGIGRGGIGNRVSHMGSAAVA